jgi:hypothetical protein
MSVLSAPPPPPPGGAPEPPAAPGAIPRLSLAKPQSPGKGHEKPPVPHKSGLNIKVAADAPTKIGGKPVVKPAKTGAVLRKRAALSPVMKAGVAVVVVAIAIGGVYSYRIFFPGPSPVVSIKAAPIVKPAPTKDLAAEDEAKKAAEAAKLAEKAQNVVASHADDEQAKIDAAAAQVPTPTPTPAAVSVMAQSQLTSDVKVNSTRIEAAPAASAEFRTFVASASIGGVFQGTPSRALINGVIVREGQVVSGALGIAFERIDADKKVIFFKDSTGAEVSKEY